MKIRNGFVSNSSSSSFLIIFKNLKSFDKFSKFEGYETFKKDINSANSESGINYIKTILEEFLEINSDPYELFNNFGALSEYYKQIFNNIYDLFELAGISMNEIDEIEKPVQKIKDEIFQKINKKDPLLLSKLFNTENYYFFLSEKEKEFVEKCKKEFDEKVSESDFSKNLFKNIDLLTEKLIDGLTKNGYLIRSIDYQDETNDGAFMESGFMPFLQRNPEKDYEILIFNQH